MIRARANGGQRRRHAAAQRRLARIVQPGHADFHRPVHRVAAQLLISLHPRLIEGDEFIEHALHVLATGQYRVTVGGDAQGGGLDVEQQVFGPAPQVPAGRGHQAGAGRGELRLAEGRRQLAVSQRQNLVGQIGHFVGQVVGEGVVERLVGLAGEQRLVRRHRPHLEPGIAGEREPDRLHPARAVQVAGEGASAAARRGEHFAIGDVEPALTTQTLVGRRLQSGLHNQRAAHMRQQRRDLRIIADKLAQRVSAAGLVVHHGGEAEHQIAD